MDKQSCRGGCPYLWGYCVGGCAPSATRRVGVVGVKILNIRWKVSNRAVPSATRQGYNLAALPLQLSSKLALGFRALSARFSFASTGHPALGARRVNFGQLDMDVAVCIVSNSSGLGFWLSLLERASGVLHQSVVCYPGNTIAVTGNTKSLPTVTSWSGGTMVAIL